MSNATPCFDATDFKDELPAPGFYRSEIVTARWRRSERGNDMIQVVHALEAAPPGHDHVSEYFVIEGGTARGRALSRRRLVQLYRACGLEPRAGEADLNGWRLVEWLDGQPEVANNRVHGTTMRVPNEVWRDEERPLLVRLPETRFPVHQDDVRVVDEDSTLSINGTRYSVPDLANQTVPVRLYAFHFEVLDRTGRVVFSRPYAFGQEKGRLQLDPSHYPPLRRAERGAGARIEEGFLARFPTLGPFVLGLKLRMKALAPIQLRQLLRLADRWGEDLFLATVARALDYRRFEAGAVRRILEREHPLPAGDLDLPPLGNAAGTMLIGQVEPPSLDDYGHLDRDPPASNAPSQEEPHGPQ